MRLIERGPVVAAWGALPLGPTPPAALPAAQEARWAVRVGGVVHGAGPGGSTEVVTTEKTAKKMSDVQLQNSKKNSVTQL